MTALVILKNLHLICILGCKLANRKILQHVLENNSGQKYPRNLQQTMWWKGWSENYFIPLMGGSSLKSLGCMLTREGQKQPLNQENISSGCVSELLVSYKVENHSQPFCRLQDINFSKLKQSILLGSERCGIQTQCEPIILQLHTSLHSLYTRKESCLIASKH